MEYRFNEVAAVAVIAAIDDALKHYQRFLYLQYDRERGYQLYRDAARFVSFIKGRPLKKGEHLLR